MNDWNHDGKYNHYDDYLDREAFESSCSPHRRSSSSGSSLGYLAVFIIAMVIGCFNELIGAAILLFYTFYILVIK